jgi:hypothetical protein
MTSWDIQGRCLGIGGWEREIDHMLDDADDARVVWNVDDTDTRSTKPTRFVHPSRLRAGAADLRDP